jgi:ribosome maturation factor RimP
MDQSRVEQIAQEAAALNEAFLVDVEINPNNVIVVYVDSDTGLSIDQIKMINRKIEAELDRDVEDFNLTVSSPDLNKPLKMWRQFQKNVGRSLKVKFQDRQAEGDLIEVAEEYIVLSVPGKKKKDPAETLKIDFVHLSEAKVVIKFK